MKRKIPDPKRMKKIDGPRMTDEQLRTSKVRITAFLDEEVLEALRSMAEKSGGKYQTLMNQILKSVLLDKEEGILKRIEKLEGAVFNKKAA